MVEIRKALPTDQEPVWHIIEEVISTGDTCAFDPDSSREVMISYWFGRDKHTYVAVDNGEVVGTFFLKDNQPGLGSHIANGAYMVAGRAGGKGVGKIMGEFSLAEARRLGYSGMQFNIVVKSNTRAVNLWQKIGFKIIGEIPDAFNHRRDGFTNAYIMYQKL